MSGFGNSFEKAYISSAQSSSNATLEAIREKIKQDQTKSEEAQSVNAMKSQIVSMRDRIAQSGGDTTQIDLVAEGIASVNKKEVIEPIFKAVLETAKQGPYQKLIEEGKAAEAVNNILEAGGTPPKLNFSSGNQPQQTGGDIASRITAQVGTQQATAGAAEKPAGDLVPDKINVAGVPTSYKSKTAMLAEEQAKIDAKNKNSVIKAENISQATYRFMQQFDKSYNELKAFDTSVDKEGVGGYMSRKSAQIAEHLDELPETKALKIQVLPMAQEIAAELEGGRVTDQDRKIQADKFANAISFPTTTNIRLMANGYIDLMDKGGDENGKITNQLKMLAKSDSDIFKRVIGQILVEYPEMAKNIYGEDYEVVE